MKPILSPTVRCTVASIHNHLMRQGTNQGPQGIQRSSALALSPQCSVQLSCCAAVLASVFLQTDTSLLILFSIVEQNNINSSDA